MGRLKSVIDGLPARSYGSNGPVAESRYAPIPIDELLPIDEDPKTYLEGRVAFYIALLEELIRRGASRGDIYFMKECVDALLKMTTIGRAKIDLGASGGLSKLRDEIDFSGMTTAELEEFVAKAKGEANGRHAVGIVDLGRVDSGSSDDIGVGNIPWPAKSRRRNKSSRHNDSPGREADAEGGTGVDETIKADGGVSGTSDLHSLSHTGLTERD